MTTLTAALNSSFAGIRSAEARINSVASNISNADKVGYTRKLFQSDYFTSNGGTMPVGGEIVTAILNPFLHAQMVTDSSIAASNETTYDYLSRYSDRLGTTEGENTLNASFDNLAAALEQLYISPEDNGLKFQVVANAQRAAQDLNDLSRTVQSLRQQTDSDIDQTVDRINQTVQRIDDLNKAISLSVSTGVSTADLEDDRRTELSKLSEEMSIQYFTDSNNQLKIYTEGGMPLLDSVPRVLTYTPTNLVNSTVVYPGGLSAVNLSGLDITTSITGGNLEALITLRDTTLVQEQEKLTEFATVLMRDMNAISNQGASYPGAPVITGDIDTTTLGGIGAATGFVRIATTDADGLVTSFTDFDVSTFGTVAGMLAAINGAAGLDVTATLDVDNKLVLTAGTAGEGVVFNDNEINGTASDMDGAGTGLGQFFGLNNLFYSQTASAEDITVSTSLIADSNHLPTSRLSADPALIVGDVGVNPGDGTIADELNDRMTTSTTFAAAGDFAAQSNTLDAYADSIMAGIANRADSAKSNAEISRLAFTQTSQTLYNLQCVNIDEEMAALISLESQYEASAVILGKIQDLLEELMNAVR